MFTDQPLQKPTIEEVVKDELCTGCGTCIALCPEEAIKLTINEKKGIYLPELNEEKCNNCGICLKVCPGHEVDFKQLNQEIFGKQSEDPLIGNYLNCYTGYSTNHDIRYNCSSGGLITQILIYALENKFIEGALVTRMKNDKPLEPEPFIARTKEEIKESSKSKYCPVPANIALKEILKSKDNEKFAVVGLPCHIHGIRKAELINKKLKERIILHVGIFCGTTKNFLGTTFQLKRMAVNENEIEEISYRGEGWPGSLVVQLKDKEKKLSELYYYYCDSKFCSFTPWRCTLCSDHTCELADISFGDAWLPELANDKIGTSIIISRNKVAEELLQGAVSRKIIKLNEINRNKVAQSQGLCHFKKNQLKAHIFFTKLLGKKIPVYNQKLLQSKFSDYLISMWTYFWIYVSSKRYLWILFSVQTWITKVIKYFRLTPKKGV